MTYKILSIILLGCISSILFAQAPDSVWTKTYGDTVDELLISVHQTDDGGFFLAGVKGFGSGEDDYWLIRTDSQGDTLWTQTYGDTGANQIGASQLTIDGGVIIAGLGGMWLIKTDENGDTLWTKSSGGPEGEESPWVEQTLDGGYIITGNIGVAGKGSDVGLIKIDALGVIEWTKTYGGVSDEFGRHVQQLDDGSYIILAQSFASGPGDIWLLKVTESGDSTWSAIFGGSEEEGAERVLITSDGGYAVFGGSGSFGGANKEFYLVKTDASGNEEWSQTYGKGLGDDQPLDIVQTNDSGYLMTGWLDKGTDDVDLWLIKTNSIGDTLWTYVLGNTGFDLGFSIEILGTGEYIIAGGTSSYGAGALDGWLVRVDGEEVVSVRDIGGLTPRNYSLSQNYPNPFNPVTKIEYSLPRSGDVSLIIYNLLGEELASLVNGFQPAGEYQTAWNASNVSSGIYFYRLQAGDFSLTRKMVLLK